MANSLLNSLSGLMAAERAIATTSHNIANANTDGYSRQSVTNVTRLAEQHSSGFNGAGVRVASIQRVHDGLQEEQLQSVTSEYHRVNSLNSFSNRINTLFVEENSGLNTAQIEFFYALENASNNPHDQASAEHVISSAENLVSRFNFVDAQLSSIQSELNFNIQSDISAINELSANIHALNQQIGTVTSGNSANPPNDLLDQRDSLLQELSRYVNIKALPRNGMGIDVAMANGVPLVTIAGASTLAATANPSVPDSWTFSIDAGSGIQRVREPTGGSLGGRLEFGTDMLKQTRSELGQLAATLAFAVNDAYEEIDPANANTPLARAEFFTEALSAPVSNSGNQGDAVVSLELLDPAATTTSGYSMIADGGGFTLTRLSDNVQVTGGATLTMDGISFSVNGNAVAGDTFMIAPFVGAAGEISVKNIDSSNLGAMVGSSTQQYLPVSQTMADVRHADIFNNNLSTLGEQYATMVARVGASARTAEVQLQSMDSILEETLKSHDQLSGVSLDEEAANLIKYQQAYEASARVMVASGSMFDTLIAALNRV